MTTLSFTRHPLCFLLLFWPTIVHSFSASHQSTFYSKRAGVVVSLTPSSTNWFNDPIVAWSLRLGTGLFTYASLVAILDRPRGTLLAPETLLEVRPSAVAGLGLFVTQDLGAGTVLGTYPGIVVAMNDRRVQQKAIQYPECQTYIWRFSDNSALIDPTNSVGTLDNFCSSPTAPFLFGVATTLCRINEPPKGKDVNVVTEEVLSERKVVLRLERNVVAGEELFMDYGPQYDRSAYR
ncbi:hypothetical protein FisN_33Hh059 [Fistulifera solaris]|uniref:SET domain-containing protein n=1 Tax=Fistulifera solaris TaxID=1519565 RepID=A0A1Z5KR50_FISSO|nr:hypothetical protein FisN_33Hh059 [Fistulifera solaris]|eukprot:GAX28667.1 hypothetical protein FisN_33Hh059 [Fistulifera solaris]